MTDAYDYEHFDAYVRDGAEEAEFGAFADHLHVGEAAPDAVLTRLDDGEQVTLSSLWSGSYAVVEFGSFTWPYCAAEGPLLDAAAGRHTAGSWVFVYTREAHPGEHVPAHATFDDKLAAARRDRPTGVSLAPYVTEQLEHREVDRSAFYRHLEQRNGPRSLAEFRAAERIWSNRG